MAIKVLNKRYVNDTIRVMTKKDLIDALKRRYANIIVEGEVADRVYAEMKGLTSGSFSDLKDKVITGVVDNYGTVNKLLKDYRMASYAAHKDATLKLKQEKRGLEKK